MDEELRQVAEAYERGFYDAVTPEWAAFTYADGREVALFCHIFGARVQYTYPAVQLERLKIGGWRAVQEEMIQRCAQVLARGL